MDIFHETLKQYWGYTSFRPLQEDIIRSVYNGKDTLGLMPTGGGKSLTFQVPAMVMEGLCLVVTPLIALMKDQVDNLRQRGIKALAVYSGMSHREIMTTLDNAVLGDYKFLYVSPERLNSDIFLTKLKSMNICLLVVDESHCISQWGYDFRPSYMNIASIREYLPGIPVLALTATATKDVVYDIQQSLHFKEKNVFRKSFERKNLSYVVRDTENKMEELIRILEKVPGTAIVYVRSRLKTKEIAEELAKMGFSADFYHAGLSSEEKTRKQNEWKNGQCRIIVSTNAFGMGIDKPDVRVVIHMDLPNSLEEYYQEAGRAGRDEKRAYAVLLYNKTDSTKLKKRIKDEYPERDFIKQVYDQLAYFLQVAVGGGLQMAYDFNLSHFCSVYKLPLSQAHNALKMLELAGYIEYTDETDNRSRLKFVVYRDELYKYDFDKDCEQVIHSLLRLYTGLFADYVNVDESALAFHLKKGRKEVYEILKFLAKRGIIDYIPHKKTPFIIYTQPRVDRHYLSIGQAVYEKRKERFEKRITAMTDYVTRNDICRSRMLLIYFGENNAKDCGQCDVCKTKNTSGLTNYLYNRIRNEVEMLLQTGRAMPVDEVVATIQQFKPKDVVRVVRFLADGGELELRDGMVCPKKE
ncbi:ATP-dependent DNA helicase RecQ [Dysgonomonas sp. PH5-45]|uniref:RecQ family ATP-dependent DNA helicase n=1 Tax=unclassified Dysgonomonas TaxID=2630389 RepID=UPI002475E2EC|nr:MULTISPECIES: ATP-dependent DNA helicase RecQ [unclassified Dysgonomonas]MDH6354273.1 ATP-dependent DNA helicase RecQ [Dysgonomonas sp. PH5-45]MDH6387174.1 ATP-dependent DNA helicase RecQ [Dysgonomonas sp. PH5-37]